MSETVEPEVTPEVGAEPTEEPAVEPEATPEPEAEPEPAVEPEPEPEAAPEAEPAEPQELSPPIARVLKAQAEGGEVAPIFAAEPSADWFSTASTPDESVAS